MYEHDHKVLMVIVAGVALFLQVFLQGNAAVAVMHLIDCSSVLSSCHCSMDMRQYTDLLHALHCSNELLVLQS